MANQPKPKPVGRPRIFDEILRANEYRPGNWYVIPAGPAEAAPPQPAQPVFDNAAQHLDYLRAMAGIQADARINGAPINYGGDVYREPARKPPMNKPRAYEPPFDVFSNVSSTSKPPLFMPYETQEEGKLRLVDSVIRLHGKPIYVRDFKASGNAFKVVFQKDFNDAEMFEATYRGIDSGFDLSPFPAMYMIRGNYALWAYRKPVRGVYKQGACGKNTHGNYAGVGETTNIRPQEIMKFNEEPVPVRTFDEVVQTVTPKTNVSKTLSPHLALYSKKGERSVCVEYRGLYIGDVDRKPSSSGKFYLRVENEGPILTPWCRRRLSDVGINILGEN